MGVQTDALLVYGWSLDVDKLKAWLKAEGAGSCGGKEQCTCGPSCWNSARDADGKLVVDDKGKRVKLDLFEHPFDFMEEAPYYDCPEDDRTYHLGVPFPHRSTLESLNAAPKEMMKYLRELAVEWGAEDEPAQFYAVVHIS